MLKVIKTKRDYKLAVQRIYELMQFEKRSVAETDELELLAVLTEHYEREHFPIASPTPIEALRFRMEQLQMTQSDLTKILGHRGRVPEILSGKRALTLSMMKKLHRQLHVPAEALLAN